MARTIDELVRNMLGTQALEIARLTVRVEELEEQVAQLKQVPAPAAPHG